MSLPSFNFLYIRAGEGNTGTTGEQLEVDWKTNFDLIKALLMSLDEDTQSRIMSNEIQQIKVENGIAYFTTDEGESWTSLGPAFANLSGNPEDNEALVNKFANYTTITAFNNALNRISTLESDFIILDTTVAGIDVDVATLKEQMNTASTGVLARLTAVEADLYNKITSAQVIEIKQESETHTIIVIDPDTGEETEEVVTEYYLEYTTDGVNWLPITGSAATWGQISGNITDQSDLMNRFDIVNDAITGLTTSIGNIGTRVSNLETNLTAHTSQNDPNNMNHNPHNINKQKLGLGNVDNTADINKPLSTPQKSYVDQQDNALDLTLRIAMYTKFKNDVTAIALDKEAYEALDRLPPGTDYDDLPATEQVQVVDPVTGETITVTVPIDYSDTLFPNKVYTITDVDQ